MKITTLLENKTTCDALRCEHGLSLYIETEKHKILFDSGASDAFWENARALGIDLARSISPFSPTRTTTTAAAC